MPYLLVKSKVRNCSPEFMEPELELIQPHMAQKPVLRVEVGALAWRVIMWPGEKGRVCGQPREDLWASAGVTRRLGESA